jgi:hypothetical protein
MALGVFAAGLCARQLIEAGVGLPAGWVSSFARNTRVRLPCYALALGALCILALGFWDRTCSSLWRTPLASHNIYAEQWQMARFVRRFYSGSVLALNDIGAVNYLSDIECVDLFGLATVEVARMKLAGRFETASIRALNAARGTRIALVYTGWFTSPAPLPTDWIKVGEWTIPDNVICGGDTVSFYSVDPSERLRLADNLRMFGSTLPPGVVQRLIH